MKKLIILAIALMTLSYGQAQKETLQLNLETGKTYRQVSHARTSVEQDLGGQKMTITIDIDASMSYLVKSVSNDVYDVEMRYDSIKMAMDMGEQSMAFNSHKTNMDETDYMSKMMKAFTNRPVSFKMSRTGKISEMKNMDSVMSHAINELVSISPEQREQMKEQLEKSFGGEAFKSSFEMASAIFPDKPVAKGETWTSKTVMDAGMSSVVNTTYTYAGKTASHILINGNSEIETADKEKYMEINNFSMKYDLKGTMTSDIRIDPKSGWVIEASMDQTLSGNTFIKPNDSMPEGMSIPMTIKTKSTTKNK